MLDYRIHWHTMRASTDKQTSRRARLRDFLVSIRQVACPGRFEHGDGQPDCKPDTVAAHGDEQ